jgi:hypothetical protein
VSFPFDLFSIGRGRGYKVVVGGLIEHICLFTRPKTAATVRSGFVSCESALSDTAVRLLEMQPRVEGQARVFPSPRAADRPLAGVRGTWLRVKSAADLPEAFRLHDVRHTYASCLINSGASLYEVSKLLGHS